MSIPNEKIFHLGLCMAGSITAGAYTAGVIDYLIEALEKLDAAKNSGDLTVPDHQVVIDLLSGTSGGGMCAAMANFAFRDKIEHGSLHQHNGKQEYPATLNNIFWKSWIEMRDTTRDSLFSSMLNTTDIEKQGYVASGLNSKFIDDISGDFSAYVHQLAKGTNHQPAYLCPANEVCMMVFNVTGIRYKLTTKATSKTQYALQHRDLAHFRWQKTYTGDGRIEIHFDNLQRENILIDAAKATGAFPVGLRPRMLSRPAKYIWDNPFFRKGIRFNRNTIFLGEGVCDPDHLYTSINADGGTANNEPVELCRELMYKMRLDFYKDLKPPAKEENIITHREEVLQTLTNTSIILIDPFPSVSGRVDKPVTGKGDDNTENIMGYAGKLVNAMRSTLLIDAKLTMEAYEKENYGLHLIAPSHSVRPPDKAIACGSLDGFGGFLSKEFRIHDFYLGRHNCQSFLRRYFVANLTETGDNAQCIQSVIDGYKRRPDAIKRFEFTDTDGKKWVPIIPDVTMTRPFDPAKPENVLPEPNPVMLEEDALDNFEPGIADRVKAIVDNLFDGWKPVKVFVKCFTGRITSMTMTAIKDNLKEAGLMKGKMENPRPPKPPQKECPFVENA